MCLIVLLFNFVEINLVAKLVLQINVGVVAYIAGSVIFKIESFSYIVNMLKRFKK